MSRISCRAVYSGLGRGCVSKISHRLGDISDWPQTSVSAVGLCLSLACYAFLSRWYSCNCAVEASLITHFVYLISALVFSLQLFPNLLVSELLVSLVSLVSNVQSPTFPVFDGSLWFLIKFYKSNFILMSTWLILPARSYSGQSGWWGSRTIWISEKFHFKIRQNSFSIVLLYIHFVCKLE